MHKLPFKILLMLVICTAVLSRFTCILLMTHDATWKTYAAPWATAMSLIFFAFYYKRLRTAPDLSRPDPSSRYRTTGSLSAVVAGVSTLLVPFNEKSPVWYRPTLIVAGVLLIIGAVLVLSSPLIMKPTPRSCGEESGSGYP